MRRAAALLCIIFLGFAVRLQAQPSGGPYGPVRQSYTLPAATRTVFYVAPDGNPAASGHTLNDATTLEAAFGRVQSGDAIVLRGGTYRTGDLVLNQGITIQPYLNEQPVLKGTVVASHWEALGNGLWMTKWEHLFPSQPDTWWRRNTEGKNTPLHRFNNDMVFVDGRFLQSAGWEGEVDENSFFIDYATGTVYIGVDPANRLVEITAHDVAILRTTNDVHGRPSDRKGYTLRGITLTHYAYRALEVEGFQPEGVSAERDHGNDVIGTTIEDCTITFCSRVAGYFRGNKFTMRNCRISDTSTEGVYVIASNDILLENNIFMRNNIENITGYYPAAVKIFNQCHRAICRNNFVTDLPNSNGIWYDVGEVDGVVINNWFQNVGHIAPTIATNQLWPSDNALFFEISKGLLCAGNLFVNCDHGLLVLNSSMANVYQNTFVNSMACFGRNGRTAAGDHFGWHPRTGPGLDQREGHIFANNLLTGDAGFVRPLLFVWQPAALCQQLSQPQFRELDHNVYTRANIHTPFPLVLWSPAADSNCQAGFGTLAELQKRFPGFEKAGTSLPGYDGPLFQGAEVQRFGLLRGAPGRDSAARLPEDVRKVLGITDSVRYVGAFPPVN